MVYVALLRGINVGGNRKVEMKRLKAVFERSGQAAVQTYINSGNVVFENASADAEELTRVLESAIEAEFGFPVKVLLRDAAAIDQLVRMLPDTWVNDAAAKCDVLFLSDGTDAQGMLASLTIRPEIDEVLWVPGAIIWRVERPLATKSGLLKVIGTPLYQQMTVRNCNTVRKLDALMRGREPRQ